MTTTHRIELKSEKPCSPRKFVLKPAILPTKSLWLWWRLSWIDTTEKFSDIKTGYKIWSLQPTY